MGAGHDTGVGLDDCIDQKTIDDTLDIVNAINGQHPPVLIYNALEGIGNVVLFRAGKAWLRGVLSGLEIEIEAAGPLYELGNTGSNGRFRPYQPFLWNPGAPKGFRRDTQYGWGRNFYPVDCDRIAMGEDEVIRVLDEHYFYRGPLPPL